MYVTLGLTFPSLMSAYWCKSYFLNFKKHKLDFKGCLERTQKPSVTKNWSVGFNHDAGLPYKKLIQKIKPFWWNFV